MLLLKQENAADDSAAVIEGITKEFLAMNLPRLADARIYSGAPFPILDKLQKALAEQRSADGKKKFINVSSRKKNPICRIAKGFAAILNFKT